MIWIRAVLDKTPPASIATSTSPAPRSVKRQRDVDLIEAFPFRLGAGKNDRNPVAADENGNAFRRGRPNPRRVERNVRRRVHSELDRHAYAASRCIVTAEHRHRPLQGCAGN